MIFLNDDITNINSSISKKLTSLSGFKRVCTYRNASLTYTNGSATYIVKSTIGNTNQVVGIATYAYNSHKPSTVTADSGILTITNSDNLSGTIYTSIIIFIE